MIISELIAALEKAKADHGDAVVGFYASPGVTSFSAIQEIEFSEDVLKWIAPHHEKEPAVVLWNKGS